MKNLLDSPEWQEATVAQQEYEQMIEKHSEECWNSLTKQEQQKVFCAVVRRIYDGELVKKASYRHILYDIFGFDTSAYAEAQNAGFLSLHNSIKDEI